MWLSVGLTDQKKHKIDTLHDLKQQYFVSLFKRGHVLPQQHWQLSNKLKQDPPPPKR